jgi:hypothetical protein
VHGFQKAQRQAMPPAPVRLYVCGGHKIVVIWCCSLERSDTHIPRERSRMPQLYSRHLGVTIERGVVTISYRPSLELTLGSAQRSRDILNRVTAKLKGAHPLTHRSDDEEIITQFDIHETRKLETVIAKIDLMLDRCANEPLMPRMVEEILGITSAERRRWTKDGRLPKSGMASFRRGPQSFYLSTHPPKKIGQLANNSDLIAQWRKEDAAPLSEHQRASAK